MNDIDPSQIHDPWSALTALAVLVVLALLVWTKRDAGTTRRTLTRNNGGSHVRDSLDRIEERQLEQGKDLAQAKAETSETKAVVADLVDRVSVLEGAAEKRGRHSMWRRT